MTNSKTYGTAVNQLFKAIVLCIVCTVSQVYCAELPINGEFAANEKGVLMKWSPLVKSEKASIELGPASDKKGNAIYVETDGKSFSIVNSMLQNKKIKELNFSIYARGSGSFIAKILYYDEKCSYIDGAQFFVGRPIPGELKLFNGKASVPETLNGRKIEFIAILLTLFSPQIIFEKARLESSK